jgi:hypothetical protein
MSIIEIELRSPLQLEHIHVQNIHRLCSCNNFSDPIHDLQSIQFDVVDLTVVTGRSSGSCHSNHHCSHRHRQCSLPRDVVTTTSDGALGDDCVDQINVKEGDTQQIDDEELQSSGSGVE